MSHTTQRYRRSDIWKDDFFESVADLRFKLSVSCMAGDMLRLERARRNLTRSINRELPVLKSVINYFKTPLKK